MTIEAMSGAPHLVHSQAVGGAIGMLKPVDLGVVNFSVVVMTMTIASIGCPWMSEPPATRRSR